MKKLLLLFPVFFLFLITAKATDYYIAANGNDANNGTSQYSPWKSINKVNAYFSNLRPGDKVLFKRGDVFYGTIVTTKGGGVGGAPVTIGAYGAGAKPVISGFEKLTSWTPVNNQIQKSTINLGTHPEMVIINGKPTGRGRFPNSGFLTYESVSGNNRITDNDLQTSANWTGAEIVMRKTGWVLDRNLITNHSGKTITFQPSQPVALSSGYGYFIQDAFETLDKFGEWYYKNNQMQIYFGTGGRPSDYDIKVSSLNRLIDFSYTNHVIIDNLDLEGADLEAISLINSSNVVIQNCDIIYSGNTGIAIKWGSANNIIQNNTINHTYSTAIDLQRNTPNTLVKGNTIKNTGLIPGTGINGIGGYDNVGDAIASNHSQHIIEYNVIDSAGHSGIRFGYDRVTINNNFIKNYALVRNDAGGVYAWTLNTPMTGSLIKNNVILNGIGNHDGMRSTSVFLSNVGVYLDAGCSGVTITDNSVANTEAIGYMIQASSDIKMSNNTSYNSGFAELYIKERVAPARSVRNLDISNNILFSREARLPSVGTMTRATFIYNTDASSFPNFGKINNNYYVKPIDNINIASYTTTDTWKGKEATLQAWQSYSKLDGNSKSSPKQIANLQDLRFEYNASASSKTISLGAKYIDAKGESYNGSITLAPYTSAVLIKDGEIQGQAPTVSAGDNQTITLPTNNVELKGTASGSGQSGFTYLWSKKSGPSSGKISNPNSSSTNVTDLAKGEYTFELTVNNSVGMSAVAEVSITIQAQTAGNFLPAVNPSNLENGIDFKYFEETRFYIVPDFDELIPVKTGSVNNFDISLANRDDVFAFEFTGFIDVPTDGEYTFYTTSDDGSMLYIDNELVVNNNGLHGAEEKSGKIGLKAGKHNIRVGFFEQDGSEILKVNYAGPGISKRAVPNSVLYRIKDGLLPSVNPANTVSGIDYKYFEGKRFTAVPNFTQLNPIKTGSINNFDISVANREDVFAFEFTGFIDIPADGQYTFYTTSDDGSVLYIDNHLVVDNDGLHGAVEKSGSIGLKAGKHPITVGFFEQDGTQLLNVHLSGPGVSKRAIPNSYLYRTTTGDLLPALNPANVVNGLKYNYYESGRYNTMPDFSKISPIKSGIVDDFDLKVANRAERYAISFTGYIDVPSDGQYSFYTTSDDGSMLYIDNKLVVNNDGLHSALEKSGKIGLKAGKHLITVEFFQQDYDKKLNVSYAGPGVSKQTVPYSKLYMESASNGLNYSYYEASNFTSVPDFSKMSPVKSGMVSNFDISVADRAEVFAIEFKGIINIPSDGQYTFYTLSDDGSLLYIDGKLVVNNDGTHSAQERSGSIYLSAGRHSISVGFFQQTWDKQLQVEYAGPGLPKRLIPSSELFPDLSSFIAGRLGSSGPLSSTSPLKDQKFEDNTPIKINAYPNPFVNTVNVSLGGEAGEYKLQMLDALGRILWTRTGSKNEGFYQLTLNTASLQKGSYFLRVIQNDKTSVIKLMK